MHVENVAILDAVHSSESFRTMLPDAEPDEASNMLQVIAIGAICNAANFDNSSSPLNKKTNEKAVSGNATDAAILRFSDSVASVEITRQRWTNVYRANFNSKAFL
jgi:sodium/potassium-transporting ATPase subunit alpha